MESPLSTSTPAPPVGCADCTLSSAPSPATATTLMLAERVVSLVLVLMSPLMAGVASEPVDERVAAAMEGTGMDAAFRSSGAGAPARRPSRSAARLDGVRAIVDSDLVEGDVLVELRLAVDHHLQVVLAAAGAPDLPAQLPRTGGRLAGPLVQAPRGADGVVADLRDQLLELASLGGGED